MVPDLYFVFTATIVIIDRFQAVDSIVNYSTTGEDAISLTFSS
jgi:hypothetical protein